MALHETRRSQAKSLIQFIWDDTPRCASNFF